MLSHRLLFVILALSIPLSASALSEPSVVTLENANSVDEAVVDITTTLESQGFEVVLTLNHSANALNALPEPLVLPPTTVIFARFPNFAERAVLRKGETVAIDLPVKFLVFEQDDEIHLATNSIGYLIDRHALTTRDVLLNVIDELQDQFSEPDAGLVTIQSTRSVEDTTAAIQEALLATGAFGIPLILDYGDRQRGSRYNRNRQSAPMLIVFGNPSVGTPLMLAQRTIGIDLPQKYLVWQDSTGAVNITYNDPFALADRHSITDQDARLTNVSNALNNFARMGAGL